MRRFLNGILMGGLLGAMIGLMINGNMQPQRKRLMGKTKNITKQASEVIEAVNKNVVAGVGNLMKKR